MRLRILLSCQFLSVATIVVTAPVTLVCQDVERVTLATDVYLLRTPFDGYVFGNSIVVVNDSDVTVFDSNTRPSVARRVIAEIRRITPKPVRTVINSHWHPDHWTGNGVYAREYPGVQFVATEVTREMMRRVAPAWPAVFAGGLKRREAALDTAIRSGTRPDGSALTAAERRDQEAAVQRYREFYTEMSTVNRMYPTITYNDSLTLRSGGREVRLVSLSGDADGSTVAYLPKERVLLVGDLLVHPIQWDPNSYKISPWLASLRQIRLLNAGVIVPGHGPAFRDGEYLGLVIELLDSIVGQVHTALEGGAVTAVDVQRAVKLDALRTRFTHGDRELEDDFDATMPSLIRKAYLEARDGMESRR